MHEFSPYSSVESVFKPCSRSIFLSGGDFSAPPDTLLPWVLHRGWQQALQASEIQRRHRQLKHPLHVPPSTQLHLPQTRRMLQPSEHLLHPFAPLLTAREPRVVPLLRPQPVLGPGPRCHFVLGHMRDHLTLTQSGNELFFLIS